MMQRLLNTQERPLHTPYSWTRYAIAMGGLCTAFMAGCAADTEHITYGQPGTVVGHEYDDPDTVTTVQYDPALKQNLPVTRRDPAHYYLNIRQCGHEEFVTDSNPDGYGIFRVEVGNQTYQGFPDGSSITLDE